MSKPEPSTPLPIRFDVPDALPTQFAQQPSWQLALSLDPMELSRLAAELGAVRLAALVADGGRAADVSLRAFEHAPDAHAERGELCVLLPRFQPPHRRVGLAVLERVLQGPRFDERIHPEADARCAAALTLISRQQLGPEERDLLLVSRLHVARASDVDYDRSE